MSVARHLMAVALMTLFASSTLAWGPHSEITAAALAVLSENAKLRAYLGDDFRRLSRDYCWMGDWQEAVRPDHFADDYLLFPASPRHVSHMHPFVRQTYAPFFRRALQAIRTEPAREAARWVGSLLHFVQDAGSPPHTTGIGGALHGKMERWVDEAKITIEGYRARLLGDDDEAALRGFEDRMAALHDFAKACSERLKPLVEKIDMRVNQPLELECALEVARVTADVVHTLFHLGWQTPIPGATLEGRLDYAFPTGYAQVPAKVILEGTSYSTTTDAQGWFRFRNLPPGRYGVWMLATGYETERIGVIDLVGGRTAEWSPRLRVDALPGNLVRNPRFHLRWIATDRPDGWTRDPAAQGRWASAPIRVPIGQACSVRVDPMPGKKLAAAVRWRRNPSSIAGSREATVETGAAVTLVPPALEPFEKGYLFLQVLVAADRDPETVCRHVAVTYDR